MKRVFVILGLLSVGGGVCLTLCANRYESRLRPNVAVGGVEVGGLSSEDARKKLRAWWESAKRLPLRASVSRGRAKPLEITASKAGFTIDDEASVAPIPTEDFWAAAGRFFSSDAPAKLAFEPKLKPNGSDVEFLEDYVQECLGENRPARVTYENGAIERIPEVSGCALDKDALGAAIMTALQNGGRLDLPIKEAPKTVPDEDLNKITGVIAEFSTGFRVKQASRNNNLRLASGKLNGTLIPPGATFSFNKTLGKRTIEDGYKLAGVYKNGKHDVGIGGGICQVSGTLYNAALLSNLEIVERHNHSMPVPYLPVGRDATVDFGSFDLRFKNPYDFPIAISSSFKPGRLTFRILGVPNPGLGVKILTSGLKVWGRAVQYVQDGSLAPGKEKVVEKGCAGRSISTYRVVYENGSEVKRERLSFSRYNGGPRIIARNLRAKTAAPAPSTPASLQTPPPAKPSVGIPPTGN